MNVFFTRSVFVIYFPLLFFLYQFHISTASLSLPLEHSLDGGRSFKQIRSVALHPSAGMLTLKAEGFGMTERDEKQLLELVQQNGLYHIRIRSSESEFIESSIPACQLVSSAMKAKLVVSVNDRGFPVAIHLTTSSFECHSAAVQPELPTLGFSLDIQRPIMGASPETIRYLQRLEKQREEMARAEQGDNRSFFAKYWTYIVPALILFLVVSSVQEAGGAAGSGGGGSGGR